MIAVNPTPAIHKPVIEAAVNLCKSEVITESMQELVSFFKLASQKKCLATPNVNALLGMVSLNNTAPEECVANIIHANPGNATYKAMIGTFWAMV
jgi:hypothetical protein